VERSGKQHKNLENLVQHINTLIDRQALVASLVDKQEMRRHELVQSLVQREKYSELRRQLDQLHPADIAFVLENLPRDRRQLVWSLVDKTHYGAVLLEVSNAVRETLLQGMNQQDIVGAAGMLDSDEIADLVQGLSEQAASELLSSLESKDREEVESALSFPEGTVGALMDFDVIRVPDDETLDETLARLRQRGRLPVDSRVLMVVDQKGLFQGTLEMEALLVNPGSTSVAEVVNRDAVVFHTDDEAQDAATAFQRYDLISVPVVNAHNHLVGSLNVEAVLDYIHRASQKDLLGQVGLHEEESDLFMPVWRAARNRWPWLTLNLLIAFIAALIIGQFEATISAVVALAALMPITANVGGNAGNQSLALVIRGLSTNQLNQSNMLRLARKEVSVGLVNGLVWGGVMAVATLILYGDFRLSLIMQVAMVVTLFMAGLTGVMVPATLKKLGLDPVLGSSILITGITDTMGFFIFLGFAALVLAAL
jgi:magnesium transporter